MTPAELRSRREALGLSVAALAERLGVTRAAVYNWESGKRPMPQWLGLALDGIAATASPPRSRAAAPPRSRSAGARGGAR